MDGNSIEPISPKNGRFPPLRVSAPYPPYSEEARRNRLSGAIRFGIIVDKDGSVRDVLEASPPLGGGMDQWNDRKRSVTGSSSRRLRPVHPFPVLLIVKIGFRL